MKSTVGIGLVVKAKGTPANAQRTWIIAGSGVATSEQQVVTCAHVVKPHLPPNVELVAIVVTPDTSDWTAPIEAIPKYEANIQQLAEDKDLATLRVTGLRLDPVRIGDPASLRLGDDLFFIGHPFGSVPAVGTGILAARERQPTPKGAVIDMLRVDGSVNGGNSGGGLFSRETGALVGIVSAKKGRLSPTLEQVRDTTPNMAISIGGLDPVAVLRQVLSEMGDNLQLGAGYAISVSSFSR